MNDFFERNQEALQAFADLSRQAGARADYVQGGGGNTSVKVDRELMAVKASGFLLTDIEKQAGYAVVNHRRLRYFYRHTDPKALKDVEAAGSQAARENTVELQGLAPLRPSVEAGFHALLSTYVLHSHSVYANLAACAPDPEGELRRAFQDASFDYAYIPYVDPGAKLTFSIRDIIGLHEAQAGQQPAVLLMQNHGLIAHAKDAQTCLRLHEEANRLFQQAFGVSGDDFPKVALQKEGEGFVSDIPWLHQRLAGEAYPDDVLLGQPLYPDQMVFFEGSLGKTAVIDRQSGQVRFGMGEKAALAILETLCAVIFIHETLKNRGLAAQPMGAEGQAFIGSWESEKYRKQVTEGRA